MNLRIRHDESDMWIVRTPLPPSRHLGRSTLSPDRLARGEVTRPRPPQPGIHQGGSPLDRVQAPAVRGLFCDTTRTASIVRRFGMFDLNGSPVGLGAEPTCVHRKRRWGQGFTTDVRDAYTEPSLPSGPVPRYSHLGYGVSLS